MRIESMGLVLGDLIDRNGEACMYLHRGPPCTDEWALKKGYHMHSFLRRGEIVWYNGYVHAEPLSAVRDAA